LEAEVRDARPATSRVGEAAGATGSGAEAHRLAVGLGAHPRVARTLTTFGTHEELQLLLVLLSAAVLLLLAEPLRIPYPILLVLGGLGLGFAPGVPTLTLPPEVVLIGVLPPLLYLSAFNTGVRELRRNLRGILL